MPEYRIFTVGPDGRFLGVPTIVECRDDKEAIEKAMQLKDGLDLEIWNLKRRVALLPKNPKA
jgi:hypothetical protein